MRLVTVVLVLRPSATVRATLRMTLAISRSRLRTPASCVYDCTSVVMASSAMATCLGLRPWLVICLGTRKRLPISAFSRCV